MVRILVIYSAVILALSCQSPERKPSGVLSKNKMVQVLADVYITEEKVVRLNLLTDSAALVAAVMRSKALQKSEVSDSVFSKSFDYYMDHPKDMEEIYSVLVDTLQLREQRTSHRVEQP